MAYKQGYKDRMDESLGMRRGKESTKKQSYKDRRDESKGMKGVMHHDSKPMKCNAFEAQKDDLGRIKMKPMNDRGYPSEAYSYKY